MNWKKVNRCKHEWTQYHDGGDCAIPLCKWTESYCGKCRVYEVKCLCGFESGMSGEPRKRAMRRNRKQLAHIAGGQARESDERCPAPTGSAILRL